MKWDPKLSLVRLHTFKQDFILEYLLHGVLIVIQAIN